MDRLDQMFARSLREIEAHSTELAETETGRYFINEAAQLLVALRLWAQNQYRSDQVVRETPETLDLVTLAEVAGELQETGGVDFSGQPDYRRDREVPERTAAGDRLVRPPGSLTPARTTDGPCAGDVSAGS